MNKKIRGNCPMGCGQTLVAWNDGVIGCVSATCPRPQAVRELLDDGETEHVVDIDADGFTIKHPLCERLDDHLFDCGLHPYMASWTGPALDDGRYRAGRSANGWAFEPLARS